MGKLGRGSNAKVLKTERALWFAETYGLTLDMAGFSDETGAAHTMTFSDNRNNKVFRDLPEEEQNKLKQILFIQDKYHVQNKSKK